MKKDSVSLWQSIGMLAAILATLFVGCIYFKLNTQVVLLMCTLLLAVFARFLGHSFSEIEGMAVDGIRAVAMALIINICIGMLISMWMASGTVSFFIRLFLKLIQPRFFLLEAFVFCCIFSALIGSCWICAGTVGLVLFYLAPALHINPCLLAAAIVGGSRFGACISPISESTNISKILSGLDDIYKHVRAALKIALPAALACAVVYLAIDLFDGQNRASALELAQLDTLLSQSFNGSPLVLLPVVVLGIMIYRKRSTLMCLISSIVVSGLVACVLQKVPFRELTYILFNGYGGYLKVDDEMMVRLFSRGGMLSMANVLLTLIIGISMSGILNRLGILQKIVQAFSEKIKAPWQTVLFSMLLSILGYGVTGDSQPSKVLISAAFGDAYEQAGLDRAYLSRTIEMAAFGEGMFPWTVGGVYLSSLFELSVTEYWYLIFFYYFIMLFNVLSVVKRKPSVPATQPDGI